MEETPNGEAVAKPEEIVIEEAESADKLEESAAQLKPEVIVPEAKTEELNKGMSRETVEDLDSKELDKVKRIEAAFFISGRWLSIQELVALTDINPILLGRLIDKLKDRYREDSAIEIVEKDNAWKMDVRQEYVELINKLATGKTEFTKSEQETLAVIAYKQPVKQSVIIKIRGNKAYEHVHNFVSLGLVKSKKAGHTNELSLSEDFYDYFHIGDSEKAPEKEG